jgi:hypothetical protein
MDVVGCEIEPWKGRHKLIAERIYKSDAKTHRTPKALRAKFMRERDYFAKLWSAHASSRRFSALGDIAARSLVRLAATTNREACETIRAV